MGRIFLLLWLWLSVWHKVPPQDISRITVYYRKSLLKCRMMSVIARTGKKYAKLNSRITEEV